MKLDTHQKSHASTPVEPSQRISPARRLRSSLFAALALLAGGQLAQAQLSNGGFEAGALTDWQLLNSSEPNTPAWQVYSGTARPVLISPEPFTVNTIPAPVEGSKAVAAVSPDFGYGYTILYRSIVLAPGQTHILKFNVAYHNWLRELNPTNPAAPLWLNDPDLTREPDDFANHQFRVDIIDPAAALGSTAPADVKMKLLRTTDSPVDAADTSAPSMGWTEITADLSAYAGQTVVLRFAVSQSLYFLDAFVDNVRLNSTPLDMNQPPTAVPGPNQPIHTGVLATLNGGGSFDDNTPAASLAYSWSFFSAPAGNTATLNNANTATPSFTPDVIGDYVLQLIVTDNGMPPLSSAPAYVTLSSFNQAPTAVAGATPLLPTVAQTVTLDGTGSSDPENDSLTYLWTVLMRPAGSVAPLMSATSATASITPDLPGLYKVQLSVSDFLGAGAPAVVTFVASTPTGFAEQEIRDACAIVQALSPGQVSNKGNQKDFCKILQKALKHIQKMNYCKAVKELDKAIARTDGCPLRGTPDNKGGERDWITDCAVQTTVYGKLIAARTALAGLPDCNPNDNDDDDDI